MLGEVKLLKAENSFFGLVERRSAAGVNAVDFFCHLVSPVDAITDALDSEMKSNRRRVSGGSGAQRFSNG